MNWDKFAGLPGAANENFEALCRALMRSHYGRFGEFGALAQQPGVEFHINFERECDLGGSDRWFGWQCRWYDIQRGRAIGTNRRNKILEALDRTKEHLPNLTDWVLWTKHPLTKRDQKWFRSIKTGMRLHLWADNEVEQYLNGPGEMFRRTYFGDLSITPDDLSELHRMSTARVAQRWLPKLHQTVNAEREINRKLGRLSAWAELSALADRIDGKLVFRASFEDDVPASLRDALMRTFELARACKSTLGEVSAALDTGELESIHELVSQVPSKPEAEMLALPRHLRSLNNRTAADVTNLLSDVRSAIHALRSVVNELATRQIGVIAKFGAGKTQLSAQITAQNDDCPAGILLHGRDLSSRGNLNLLAQAIEVHGSAVETMNALAAALDAAGRRSNRRLPIVIDGLNEAEDPRDWEQQLASLDAILENYPYVMVVNTVRPDFERETLPESVARLEFQDFGIDACEAIDKYLAHYRIDATDSELPIDFLRHPLTLRIFCEVTNPERQNVVGIEAMPHSLTALFERYLQATAKRITELSPLARKYYEHDVRSALDELGAMLWNGKSRNLDLSEMRRRLGDDVRPWNESIVRAFEQNGILHRVNPQGASDPTVSVIYDALAGHLVAEYLIAKLGRSAFESWIGAPERSEDFTGPWSERHPLAPDILRSFSGLVPRRHYRRNFWTYVDEPLRTSALRDAADLEGSYIDEETVNGLIDLIARDPAGNRGLFDRVIYTHHAPDHPLNSDFLERALIPLSIADRDLGWSEWVRNNDSRILDHLINRQKAWSTTSERGPSDRLRAQWVKWLLTSTVPRIRDEATCALYWYGRHAPENLFEITVDSLTINDPYVYERCLAATYGVTMAYQHPEANRAKAIRGFLLNLVESFATPNANHPTNDRLSRTYVEDIFDFARRFYPDLIPSILGDFDAQAEFPFSQATAVEPIEEGDIKRDEVVSTLYQRDGLHGYRSNFPFDNSSLRALEAHILGTVWTFGWRSGRLGFIADPNESRLPGGLFAENYSAKYSKIGFRTFQVLTDDSFARDAREVFADQVADYSFPQRLQECPVLLPAWTKPTPVEDSDWVAEQAVEMPNDFLNPSEVASDSGPWIAVSGYLTDKKQELGREVFGFVIAMLVSQEQAEILKCKLNEWDHLSKIDLPHEPTTYVTFAGEIPWSPRFTDDDRSGSLYHQDLRIDTDATVEIEMLSHSYSWESRSRLGTREVPVPSALFSNRLGLMGKPQTFDQFASDGSPASKSLGGPAGFGGRVLYLREDLVRKYADGRSLVWFVRGERWLIETIKDMPQWLSDVRANQQDIWRCVTQHERF